MGKRVEQTVAVLNGLIGDHLARTGNGLATALTLVHDGAPIAAREIGARLTASPRAVVLVHGLMGTERVWAMGGDEGDFGRRLAADLAMTPLYVRYNSGRPIADNGIALAELLEGVIEAYPGPLDELVLLGHSMGGLVARSACGVAVARGHRWLAKVRRAIYVGTPHQGSPLERWGRMLARGLAAIPDPYTRLMAQIGDLRSAGIKDLADRRHPVPLLPEIRHLLIAGTIAKDPTLATWFGDALVPVASATDGHAHARSESMPEYVKILPGVGHMKLAFHPDVYALVRDWCAP
jgi:triacylglycerol lipase